MERLEKYIIDNDIDIDIGVDVLDIDIDSYVDLV